MNTFRKKISGFFCDIVNNNFPNLKVKDIVVGVTYTGVLLTDNSLGVISTPYAYYLNDHECHVSRDIGKMTEIDLCSLINKIHSNSWINRVIGYCTINAVSQSLCKRKKENKNKEWIDKDDVVEIIQEFPDEPIFMIGEIKPLIKSLVKRNRRIFVKDYGKKKEFLEEYKEYLGRKSGILIISGSTISNETFFGELEYFNDVKLVILIGPSAQMHPDFVFHHTRVDVLASMSFLDPGKIMSMIKQGGGTPNFLPFAKKYTLQKI
ncbi:MAG: Rossmann-like domain-containing protein [Promethearchaeota archaeon]